VPGGRRGPSLQSEGVSELVKAGAIGGRELNCSTVRGRGEKKRIVLLSPIKKGGESGHFVGGGQPASNEDRKKRKKKEALTTRQAHEGNQ